MARREPCGGQHAASAPSDFSNCSSRLDRSVASIPGPGREHGKSGQPKPSWHHRDAPRPHLPPASASLGDGASAGEDKQRQSLQQLPISHSEDRSTRLCSPRRDQFGHSPPRPSTGGNVLGKDCKPVGATLQPSPPQVPGTGPATWAASSTAASPAGHAQPSTP